MKHNHCQMVNQFSVALTLLTITFCCHLSAIAGGSDQPYEEGLFPDLPPDMEPSSELTMPEEKPQNIRQPVTRNQRRKPTVTTPGLDDFQSWQKTQSNADVTCYENNFYLICLTSEQLQEINH